MDFLFTIAVLGVAVVFVHCLSERLCRWMEEVNARLESRWRDSGKLNQESKNGEE
jgi:hypothetical protein